MLENRFQNWAGKPELFQPKHQFAFERVLENKLGWFSNHENGFKKAPKLGRKT